MCYSGCTGMNKMPEIENCLKLIKLYDRITQLMTKSNYVSLLDR